MFVSLGNKVLVIVVKYINKVFDTNSVYLFD